MTPAKVQVGEQTPWGVATAFCLTNPLDGRWACATHGIPSFADAASLVAHVDDATHEYPCRLGFHCWADDQLHGFTSASGASEPERMEPFAPPAATRRRHQHGRGAT